jgi:hypothetical protein
VMIVENCRGQMQKPPAELRCIADCTHG